MTTVVLYASGVLLGAVTAAVLLTRVYIALAERARLRYEANPNGPRGLFLETDEVIWKDEAL
jgi:hypothetical protein